MGDFKSAAFRSLMHVIYIVIGLSVGLFLFNFFKDDMDVVAAVKGVLLQLLMLSPGLVTAFFEKFVRTHPALPGEDHAAEI